MALLGNPDLLVLDEPINGLDADGMRIMREVLVDVTKNGATVVVSSHILGELEKVATHYGIIDHGRMVKELSAEELDAARRKCVRMEVSDTAVLARVMDELRLKYKIISGTIADVFAKVTVKLTLSPRLMFDLFAVSLGVPD
jgi:ABC-2 type transport system ATP-binding protein